MDTTERKCLTCGQAGHWHLHCPVAPFGEMVAAAFGLPLLPVLLGPAPANDPAAPSEAKG